MTQPPDWILALAEICEQTSQASASRELGLSKATLSLLLRGAYPHDTARLEAKVRAFLKARARACPVLGQIPLTRCFEEQAAPYFPSPLRSDLVRACRSCNHRQTAQEAS